jgi:hypothetical protein
MGVYSVRLRCRKKRGKSCVDARSQQKKKRRRGCLVSSRKKPARMRPPHEAKKIHTEAEKKPIKMNLSKRILVGVGVEPNSQRRDRMTKLAADTLGGYTRKVARPARSRAGQSKTESRTYRSKTEQINNDESEATFVDMFFEVAGNLDPWMTESESESGSESDNRTENADERNEEQTDEDRGTDGMAAGRDTEEFPRTSDFTEIRLQHTPGRRKAPPPDEEYAAQQGMSSRKSKQVSASSQN